MTTQSLRTRARFLAAGLLVALAFSLSGQGANAPLPAGESTRWADAPVEELAPGRGRVVLNGLWRFQPAADGAQDVARLPEDWGWIRVPGVWGEHREWPVWRMPGVLARADAWREADLNTVGAAWYEREIVVPADWSGRAVWVELTRVSTDAIIFVDGQAAGEVRWPAGEADVTRFVRPGKPHRLRVLVRATPHDGEVLNLMDFNSGKAEKSKLKTRGLIDDVLLVSRPQGPRVEGLFIRTSVSAKRLEADVELADWPKDSRQATVAARVLSWPGGEEVASLPARTVDVENAVARTGWDWIAPALWDIGQPNLYTLELTLSRPDAPAPLDTWRERFGFREFTLRGKEFFLNGAPLRLRPFYQHNDNTLSGVAEGIDTQVAALLQHGFNFWEMWPRNWNIRGEAQFNRLWADAADRMGLGISLPFAHPGQWMGGPFWDNKAPVPDAAFEQWKPVLRADWKRYRNHPSLLIWIGYANMFSHGDDQNPRRLGNREALLANGDYANRPRMGSGLRMLDEVRALDNTRPITTHHGGPTGDFQTVNHYLNLMPLQEREEHPSAWAAAGDMPFLSIEFGVPFSLTFTRGRNGYGGARVTEPLVTEHAASYLGLDAYRMERPEYRARIEERFQKEQTYADVDNGETIFHQPSFQSVAELFIRNTWRSWRAWGVTGGMIPWSGGYAWRGAAGDVALPAFTPGRSALWFPSYSKRSLYFGPADTGELTQAGRALVENNGPTLAWISGPAPGALDSGAFTSKDSRFFAGDRVEKSVMLANDERQPRAFEAELVVMLGGKELRRENLRGELAVGENKFAPFSFTVPAVTERADGELLLRARIGEREHADRFAWSAFPARQPVASPVEALAFDPEGETSALLVSAGWTVGALSPDANPDPAIVLVVGRRAWDRMAKTEREKLNYQLLRHAAAGGRSVIFAQSPETVRALGYRVSRFASRRFWPVSTQAAHPVLDGLKAEDFTDWAGKGSLIPEFDAPEPTSDGKAIGQPPFGYRWGLRGTVSSAAIEKPHRSAWTPILEGEFDLAYSPLLELRHGPGRVLWCQLELEGRVEQEPAARRLLGNLLAYLATPEKQSGPRPDLPADYLGGEDGRRLLVHLGVDFRSVSRIGADTRLVIVGADATVRDDTLRAFLRSGGRVVFLPRAQGRLPLGLAAKQGRLTGELAGQVPAWPETAGLSWSDLRPRTDLSAPLIVPSASAEIAAGGLLARVSEGRGAAFFFQVDPLQLPVGERTYLRYSQWRLTRAFAQVLAGAGARFTQDRAALVGVVDPFAPIPLAGAWRVAEEARRAPDAADESNVGRGLRWHEPDFDASAWATTVVPGALEAIGPDWSGFDGVAWLRTEFMVPEEWAGRDAWLQLGSIQQGDVTYVNGNQIGRVRAEADDSSRERRYRVPAWVLRPGRNVLAIRVHNLRGPGGLAARDASVLRLELVDRPSPETPYVPGFRTDHALGDDPARYYRW